MGSSTKPPIGSIVWRDLTVADAETVRDFYQAVTGWKPAAVNMGEYDDYNMCPPDGKEAVAGICHARGSNAGLPPQWLVYITVADAVEAAERCRQLGGSIIDGPRSMGGGTVCVIQDPAGAVAALFST